MEQTPPRRNAYPSDLREGEWALLEPLVPAIKPGGRPARHHRREIVNAILYIVHIVRGTSCVAHRAWRQPVAGDAA